MDGAFTLRMIVRLHVKDISEFIYSIAATGSVNPIALAALSANFVPFGKVFKGLTLVGRR